MAEGKHEVGLLLNFGPKADIKRKVYDNERKGSLAWTQIAQTLVPHTSGVSDK